MKIKNIDITVLKSFAGGIGRGGNDFHLLLCCLIFMPVVFVLITGQAMAQQTVTVESEIISESDLDMSDLIVPPKKSDNKITVIKLDDEIDFERQRPSENILKPDMMPAHVLREEDVLKINESLRRAIEQSRRLQDEKGRLDEELRSLRGQTRLEKNRADRNARQIEEYQERLREAVKMKQEFEDAINDMKSKIEDREAALLERIKTLETAKKPQVRDGRQVSGEDTGAASVADGEASVNEIDIRQSGIDAGIDGKDLSVDSILAAADVIETQKEGLDVIRLLDDLESMRQEMNEDQAIVHYNMGNIFFHQGKYKDAVNEYRKAIAVMPDDPFAHFNLAFIAGDYLHDFQTAIEHYQQYLFLNPAAEDENMVREKIIEAQLYSRTWKDAEVDREVHGNRAHRLYNW